MKELPLFDLNGDFGKAKRGQRICCLTSTKSNIPSRCFIFISNVGALAGAR